MKASCIVRRLSFGILLLAVMSFAAVPAAQAQVACRDEAQSWVEANLGDLPRDYEEISRFPMRYRRAIYAQLSAGDRSELWQRQFEIALQRDDLTEEQRGVILEAVQLATPENLATMKNRESWRYRQMRQQMEQLEERARAAFGAERARELFAGIGPDQVEPPAPARRIFGLQEVQPVQDPQPAPQPQPAPPKCACADASDWCPSDQNCVQGGCRRVYNECGTLWTYDCDGLCKPNEVVPVPTEH